MAPWAFRKLQQKRTCAVHRRETRAQYTECSSASRPGQATGETRERPGAAIFPHARMSSPERNATDVSQDGYGRGSRRRRTRYEK
eukprot:962713-Pyramimonas_sp.AAC.1